MANMGGFSVSGLRQLQEQLNRLDADECEAFAEACAKELAARLLRKVIKRTPVGDYPSRKGKKGGTLRRGWTAKTQEEAAAGKTVSVSSYVESLRINHIGNKYVVDIVNPVEYASYVEYGHRTRNHTGWVSGVSMLTISEQELQSIAPQVLERKVKRFLGECMR